MLAVRFGLLEVIKLLVSKGADLYEKNHRGDNLLHIAAKTDKTDIVGYLLDKGLNTIDRN